MANRVIGESGRPVRWAHHPAEVVAVLKACGIRPRSKQCHANSQRFLQAAEELRPRLEYREGLVRSQRGTLFEHAWLTLDGEILDLTLDSRQHEYVASYAIEFEEVAKHLAALGSHQLIGRDRLKALWAKEAANGQA